MNEQKISNTAVQQYNTVYVSLMWNIAHKSKYYVIVSQIWQTAKWYSLFVLAFKTISVFFSLFLYYQSLFVFLI